MAMGSTVSSVKYLQSVEVISPHFSSLGRFSSSSLTAEDGLARRKITDTSRSSQHAELTCRPNSARTAPCRLPMRTSSAL